MALNGAVVEGAMKECSNFVGLVREAARWENQRFSKYCRGNQEPYCKRMIGSLKQTG